MIGYFLAILSSIFFSLYVIPRKFSKLHPAHFSFWMSIGFLLSSVLLFFSQLLIGYYEETSLVLLWSVLAGSIWALGFVFFIKAIDSIGLVRSNQWKNLQGPIGVILSLLIIGEWSTTNPIFAILAGLSIFLSAIFFNISNSKEEAKFNVRGVYLAIISGLAFGLVTVINKYVVVNSGVYLQQIVWSFSITVTLFTYIVLNKSLIANFKNIKKKDVSLGLLAGVFYLGASFFMLESYRHLPASISFTIIQLNAIWTISAGIFIFKEIDLKRHQGQIFFGFLFALIGIMLLVFAKK